MTDNLRSKVIRLAHARPEFRAVLLPLIKEAGYGRGYGQSYKGDPRWMEAKYPGMDSKGNSFRKGDEVLYWPSTKTFMTGKDAKDAWQKFMSEKGDEEGNPYAR